ncbi:Nucleolar protein 9 [Cryptotrichosporon argae]
MPKEQIRKRGKRKPKAEDEFGVPSTSASATASASASASTAAPAAPSAGPADTHAGIHPSRLAFLNGERPRLDAHPAERAGAALVDGEGEGAADWTRGSRIESDVPFGVLDPDVKAYFRDVEERIKDWEGVSSAGEEREDRQIFLQSVLAELRGHELQVATDPDTAVVLERLLPSLGDWGRRVIGDAVGEGWELLLRHRFGSHVGQTWLTLAADTLDREARGVVPPQQAQAATDGELPTMVALFTAVLAQLSPALPTLLAHPHASPPIRLLLLVLLPNRALPSLEAGGVDGVRSKRSNKFRKGQGVKGKSILGDDDGDDGAEDEKKKTSRKVPAELVEARREVVGQLRARIADVEWKSLGVSQVGSPVVQLLLEVEAADGSADTTGSLLDVLSEGLITHLSSAASPAPAQAYPASLLTSQTGTRLFEALLLHCPPAVFAALWATYVAGKAGKLAAHPYANYVLARGVRRLDAAGVGALVDECKATAGGKGMIKTARTAVLLALVERAAQLGQAGDAVTDLLKSALDMPQDTTALVPCLLTLKTYPTYTAILTGAPLEAEDELPADALDADAEAAAQAAARRSAWENRRQAKPAGTLEVGLQGCLLAQACVGLAEASAVVLDSLLAQPAETMQSYATSPIASRLLDAALTSSVPLAKYRKKLLAALVPLLPALAADRIGSRVVDTAWAAADGFMRERIARALVPHATSLGNDRFGKYVVRKMELYTLERRPDEWRERQIGVRHHFAHEKDAQSPTAAAAGGAAGKQEGEDEGDRKRKRGKRVVEDEIDDLFAGVQDKKKARV